MTPNEKFQLTLNILLIICSALSYFDKYQSLTYTIILAVVRIICAILTTLHNFHFVARRGETYTYVVAHPTERPLSKEDPCPITFEPFNPGNIYAECQQCHYCFHTNAICQSLMNCGWVCPICRTEWEYPLTFYKVPSDI